MNSINTFVNVICYSIEIDYIYKGRKFKIETGSGEIIILELIEDIYRAMRI